MRMMSSDLEHWYLDATVFKDRVEEIHYISDPARNVRRRRQTRVWQVESFLGRGGFGEVRLERNQDDEQHVRAVKRIATTSAALSHSECEKELKALLEFSKPKFREAAVFVDFFGWFKDGNDIFLAMEYLPLGDLEKNVTANSGKIPENEAREIAEQILSGLEIMHTESFAHRDLKPQNVLVVNGSPKWWVKLADFGLSKRLTDTTAYYTRGGTQSYMAPELLNLLDSGDSSSNYTNAVDIWSAGCIFYRLITGFVPFPPGIFLMKYCEDESLFPYHALFEKSSVESEGVRFLRQLLMPCPSKRPSASQALKHNWIHSYSSIGSTPSSLSRQPHPTRARNKSEVSNPTVSEVHFNTPSRAGLQSQFSNLTLSEVNFNTFSHPGLQSHQSSPPGSVQTALPPAPTPEISLPSSEATINPYPVQPETAIRRLVSQTLPKDRGAHRGTPPEKIAASFSTSETLPKAIHRADSSATSKPHKRLDSLDFLQRSKPDIFNDYTVKHILNGHAEPISSLAFSPDGKLLASASPDCTMKLWDSTTGDMMRTLADDKYAFYHVAFSPDGKLIGWADCLHGTVQFIDTATGEVKRRFEGCRSGIYRLAFSADGKLIASIAGNIGLSLREIATGLVLFNANDEIGFDVAFSRDGKLIASACIDGTIKLRDSRTGFLQRTLEGHTERVSRIAFSLDGKLASASYDKTIRVWNTTTGEASILEGHTMQVLDVAFSGDGRLASSSLDRTVRIWDPDTRAVTMFEGRACPIAFSVEGKLALVLGDNRTVQILETT